MLVNASAIGFYGPHGAEELTEDSPAGDDELARMCVDWEKAARAAEPLGVAWPSSASASCSTLRRRSSRC